MQLLKMCGQDTHLCPIKEHGITPVAGTASYKSNGKHVIRTGDVSGCGATLISGSLDTKTD